MAAQYTHRHTLAHWQNKQTHTHTRARSPHDSTHVLQFNTFALSRTHMAALLTLLMPSPSALSSARSLARRPRPLTRSPTHPHARTHTHAHTGVGPLSSHVTQFAQLMSRSSPSSTLALARRRGTHKRERQLKPLPLPLLLSYPFTARTHSHVSAEWVFLAARTRSHSFFMCAIESERIFEHSTKGVGVWVRAQSAEGAESEFYFYRFVCVCMRRINTESNSLNAIRRFRLNSFRSPRALILFWQRVVICPALFISLFVLGAWVCVCACVWVCVLCAAIGRRSLIDIMHGKWRRNSLSPMGTGRLDSHWECGQNLKR